MYRYTLNLIISCFITLFFWCASPLIAADHPLTQIQAIIFDCDGVLVDTEHLKFLAWQEALKSQNIEFSIEEYVPLVGHSSENILKAIELLKQQEVSSSVIQLKNAKYKKLQGQGVPPIQPMVDFARHLSQSKKWPLALVSSAPRDEILTNLQQVGLENVFDYILSGADDLDDYIDVEGKNKPKPYIYIEASKRLHIAPELCLVFEDTAAGVNAAADAGMIAIAVPNSFTSSHNFSKATQVLSSHEELRTLKLDATISDMTYTIVLTPTGSQAIKYIEASQTLCSSHQPSYLLASNGTSSPHITVVQFRCDSLELAQEVWASMCEKMKEKKIEPFVPPFVGISFIEGVGPYVGTTWIELSIKRGERDSPIMQAHDTALEVLKEFHLEPLNASDNNYRPHLTLGRIVMPEQFRAWPSSLFENPEPFKLELGLSDDKWQYAHTLAAFP